MMPRVLRALFLASLLGAPPLARADETATQLMQEGVSLHDKGDYDGAIEKYRAALKLEPRNLHVQYELVFSLYAKKDLAEAERIARSAAKEKSDVQAGFWMMLGNIDDDSGKLQSAIADYQEAIRNSPTLPLAHFNLGVCHFRNGNLEQARGALELEAALNPMHPGTQLMLGKTFAKSRFRVPALLAYSRFLFLEPQSGRSREAREALDALFSSGVKVNSPGQTTITVDPAASKAEGDFSGAEIMIPMSQVTSTMDPKDRQKGTPLPFEDLEAPIQRLASVLSMVAEAARDEKNGGFAADYYLPFLVGLTEGRRMETFARVAYSGAKLPRNDEWIRQHDQDIDGLRSWAMTFKWPSPSPRLP